jgi:hypothetical protein
VAYDAVAASDGLGPAVREFNSASKLYTANFRSLGLGSSFRRFGAGLALVSSSPRKDGSDYADLVLPRTFSRLRLAKESGVFLDLFSNERGYGPYRSRFSVILMNMHMEGAGKRNLVR